MDRQCVLHHVDVVAVHGFPLDWNHWTIHEWPEKLEEVRAGDGPAGVGIGGGGLHIRGGGGAGLRPQRTAELLIGRAERIHWYSLFDLPRAWPATTRHREAEGSAYYRHFYMGLLREDGTPKLAARDFSQATHRGSASASGSTSKTTGWTMPCAGCAAWASSACARD